MNMTCLWKVASASVLLLAVVSVIAKPSLLASDECLDDISWPDPTNCSRYYVCAPWGPQIMDCPDGLQYNPELQVCDWPQAVGCVVSTTSTEAPSTTVPPGTPTAEAPSTAEPSTEEPSTVEPSTEEPSTDEPSTDEPSTEEPSTVEPSTEEPSTDEPSTEVPSTEEPSTDLPEEPSDTTEGLTEDPTETEKPSTESPEETETPEVAEPTETSETELPTSSEPEPTVTDLPVDPTTTISPSDICAEFPDLFFITSYASDCAKFIACSYGEPNILSCPTGLFFNPLINLCVSDSSHCT